MNRKILCITFLIICLACKKSAMPQPPAPPDTDLSPKAVTKTAGKKIFVHMMPWFETNQTNGGVWGIHWKMNTRNPDIMDANGQRQIAANYYPLIGPYASGDTMVIEYQLLLMKLSGIDGVFIDWPGTQNKYDYPLLVRNTKKIVSILSRVGLQYAIVYEDQNLVNVSDKIGQAKLDMNYMQDNFFQQKNYEKISEKPLLLVFGPQQITTGADWTSVFSVLPVQPDFFTLLYESNDAGVTAAGEYSWVSQDNLTTLNNYYNRTFSGKRMGSAYPGFNSFYAQGGWGGPTWTIAHDSLSTFATTLDLALSKSFIDYIQLVTWNDYGEGTIIEPTKEFGYGYLTMLQQKLGVSGLSQTDLELVARLYKMRKDNAGLPAVQYKLDQVSLNIGALNMSTAKNLLDQL